MRPYIAVEQSEAFLRTELVCLVAEIRSFRHFAQTVIESLNKRFQRYVLEDKERHSSAELIAFGIGFQKSY